MRKVAFQERHFEFLAESLKLSFIYAGIVPSKRIKILKILIENLKTTNSKFKPKKFIDAVVGHVLPKV